MDTLITSYFTKATNKHQNASSSSKKRQHSNFEEDRNLDTPTNATKRSKVTVKGAEERKSKRDTKKQPTPIKPHVKPAQTPRASSRAKSSPRQEVISISSVETGDARKGTRVFQHLPSSMPSGTLSSLHKPKIYPRETSIIPATPQHARPRPSSGISLTPITFRGLTQSYSDETVGSSQSQEDEEYEELPRENTRSPFHTPQSNRATAGASAFEVDPHESVFGGMASPQVVVSSQSQYMSMAQASPLPLRYRATLLIENDLELVPSSQSQEKELEINQSPLKVGWQGTNRKSPTPEAMPSFSRDTSFSKILPVRKLSLAEGDEEELILLDDEDEGDLALLNNDITPRARLDSKHSQDSFKSTSPSQRDDPKAGESFPVPVPSPAKSVSSFGPIQSLPSSPLQPSPLQDPALEPSETQDSVASLTQWTQSVCSLPPEVKAFQDMFQGEESYPDDFPMSLRI